MVTIRDEERFQDQWYLDSRCSSHMTGRKDWFVNMKPSMKSMVKFVNEITLAVEGIRDFLIMRKDGKRCCVTLSVLIVLACWVLRIEMAGRGRDDAAIAEALGMLAGVLGGIRMLWDWELLVN
ncbi:hypothetical protein KIW84_076445 [Lathyrus oleraceus]|uniref:Retrovirus-related Pol polyprotein from transposon TNT 1-94-like beta-barrel domain-containing protein n=1 Tax=Pisum sativum TaxID=3888 RepID=A0A9D4VXV0_PEA|nr:hypothetical protein KIW84_076445 [Pisum sativum]